MPDGRKSYAKALVQERTGRGIEELLRELYVERRHTQQEIADALGVNRMAINGWLREYGITRDDRGPVEIAS